jgi:myo-inositol-1(or 4)-monophosphatase
MRTCDWQKILNECVVNVKTHVQPLLKTLKEPQPDLGLGAGGDQTKLVDLVAEKAIVETLLGPGVSFTLVSEESGVKEFGDKARECYVTVDPIDGTTNLVHGLPFYCTSIAVSTQPCSSSVFAGCVSDLSHDVTYMALEGKGAFRDGTRLVPSATEMLDKAVIGLDMNTYKRSSVAPQLISLIKETRQNRHFGANALEVCFVADGLIDAFVDVREKIRATDVAAAFLIVKEAGGVVTSPEGEALDVRLDPLQTLSFVASGNRTIHKRILELLKSN